MNNIDILLKQFEELTSGGSDIEIIKDNRRLLTEFLEELRGIEDYQFYTNSVSNLRIIKPETFQKLGAVMFPEWYQVSGRYDDIAYQLLSMQGRFLFPVKDSMGNTIGVVGYDAVEEPKYLDLKMMGYRAKEYTFLGMENIREYYSNNEPVFFPEGSMCHAFLIQEGFCSLSMLGSYISNYNCRIIKRFGRRAIIVPDNDAAGDKLRRKVKLRLPDARILRLASAKDIDDIRKLSDFKKQILLEYLSNASGLLIGKI